MKKHRLHATVGLIAAVLLAMAPAETRAADDSKFNSEAAKTAWSLKTHDFDPKADMSDSLFANASAAYIAYYDRIDAKFESDRDFAKYSMTGRGVSSATKAVIVKRRMIKLNDMKAVEEFSEFKIDAMQKHGYDNYDIIKTKSAFGARVHKPDGTIVEVDTSDALTLTEGKKGDKESSHRLAIPNLEPGDVIDFFYYDEIYIDELSLDNHRFQLLRKYPVRTLMLDCLSDPELTVEYRSYNGAHNLTFADDVKDRNHISLRVKNVDALETMPPYISEARQIPFVEIAVLNNNPSPILYHPKTARKGGATPVYTGSLLADVACSIVDSKYSDEVKREAMGIIKKWRKEHPDATEQQLTDAAWLATFMAFIEKVGRITDRQMAVAFSEIVKALKIDQPVTIGITSSRMQVPVTQAMHYNDPRYFNRVGDRIYMLSPGLTFAPGEYSGYYSGEETVEYPSDRKLPDYAAQAKISKIADSAPRQNVTNMTVNLSLDTENDMMKVNCDLEVTGAMKQAFDDIATMHSYKNAVNAFLGRPVKISKDRLTAAAEGRKEVKESIEAQVPYIAGGELKDIVADSVPVIGVTPDAPVMKFGFSGEMEGTVTKAGANLLVNVGRFTGEQRKIQGNQRRRDIDIIRRAPDTFRVKIIFDIPEGYTVDPASIEGLARNVVTRSGNFFAGAKVDGNRVIIDVNERYNRAIYPVSAWDDILALTDAAVEFTTASLVLVPAK